MKNWLMRNLDSKFQRIGTLKTTQNYDTVSNESFLSICQQALDARAP